MLARHSLVFISIMSVVILTQSRSIGQNEADPLAALQSFQKSMSPEEREVLREQLLTFAPYASMHSRFRVTPSGESGAEAVLTDWTDLRTLNEDIFDVRVQLQTAYRDLRAFMVRTEGSAVPMLEALRFPAPSINPVEYPEMALAELLFYVTAEMSKNEALRIWSRDHDETCRAAYARILPLLRQIVDDTAEGPEYVHLRHWFVEGKGVFIEALNLSGLALHNVTLHVRFATLDGSRSDHYYFIPEWPAERAGSDQHRRTLRMASDWLDVGAAATTSATVEVIADEYAERVLKFDFDDHIPTAADRLLDINQAKLGKQYQLALVVKNARMLESRLRRYPERLERAKAQRARAQDLLDTTLGQLDEEIASLQKQIKNIKSSNLLWKQKSSAQRSTVRRELRAKIKALQAKKIDLRSGRY